MIENKLSVDPMRACSRHSSKQNCTRIPIDHTEIIAYLYRIGTY